jgi:hypothetical protein
MKKCASLEEEATVARCGVDEGFGLSLGYILVKVVRYPFLVKGLLKYCNFEEYSN